MDLRGVQVPVDQDRETLAVESARRTSDNNEETNTWQ
jgi:hypothetical protein